MSPTSAGLYLLVFLVFLEFWAACSHSPPHAQPSADDFWADHPFYVEPRQFEKIPFPPPPPSSSQEDEADLRTVMDWQNKRTPQDCAQATKEKTPSYENFFGSTQTFEIPLAPAVKTFFWQLRSDTAHATMALKNRFQHPRPYERNSSYDPCIKKVFEGSYPSGHAVISRVFALVLSDLIPENKAIYFQRADEIGLHRVIAGVHYPSDIDSGRIFADLLYKKLSESSQFQTDLNQIKKYIIQKKQAISATCCL